MIFATNARISSFILLSEEEPMNKIGKRLKEDQCDPSNYLLRQESSDRKSMELLISLVHKLSPRGTSFHQVKQETIERRVF